MSKVIKKSFERKQKGTVSALCIVYLLLAGCLYSCGKKVEAGGEVPYKSCPCDEEMVLWEKQLFPRAEIFLFKDYVPDEFIRTEFLGNGEISSVFKSNYILYYSEFERALFFVCPSNSGLGILGEGLVCNFPDFAKEWLKHENGIKVYIEGSMYICHRLSPDDRIVFDYVLTSLKKK